MTIFKMLPWEALGYKAIIDANTLKRSTIRVLQPDILIIASEFVWYDAQFCLAEFLKSRKEKQIIVFPEAKDSLLFDNYKAIYMTDTKTVEGISAKNYDLYLIEGNYDEDEIEERIKEKQQDCKYVYEFRAKDSHLSKQQASEFLLNNMGENSEYVFMHQHVER